MGGRSVMEHSFANVPRANIPRSVFDRSHTVKTTFDADYIVPIMIDDVMPGDTYRVNVMYFCRLATPLFPIMDNVYVDVHAFFVPYRLLWDNWERFCGAQDDPTSSIDFTIPTVSGSFIVSGVLWDYFGIPVKSKPGGAIAISAFPSRAYNLIFNDWYRDQNLQDSLVVDTDDGPDSAGDYVLVKRGKRHDYFTSCLPAPQKGDAVSVPLSGLAPIQGLGWESTATSAVYGTSVRESDLGTRSFANRLTATTDLRIESTDTGTDGYPAIFADLSQATNLISINDLRLAFQTQRLLERDARSGTRYNEMILAHFGVVVPDFRVQRPEFLGGCSNRVNISPVANTSSTASENQGDLAAIGTVAGQCSFTKSFVEHGLVMVVANARADITYSQGLHRFWSKSTRFDFYYPVLSQIGEQSVLNKEIWVNGDANDDIVFGYQERYAEYRYMPSRLTGLFSPDASGTLAAWHVSEDFATLPALGDTFIQSNAGQGLDRAIAVPTEPHFIGDFDIRMRCARPMPVHGVPGMLDHL